MYNEAIKIRYIEEKTSRSTINQYQLPRMFARTEPFEEKLGKDVSCFTRKEAENMLKTLNYKSYDSIRVETHYLADYTNWCILQGRVPDGQNHFDYAEITMQDLQSYVSKVYQKMRIADREMVLEWCSLAMNPVDKAVMLGLFEGIKGKDYCEFVHMREGDVDFERKVVYLPDRKGELKISNELTWFLIESAEEEKYDTYEESGRTYDFKKSDLVIKNRLNASDDASDLMKGRRVHRTLDRFFKYLGVDAWMSSSALLTSGMIYMLKEESKRTGTSWKNLIRNKNSRESIEKRFNITIAPSKFILKYEEFLGD